MFNVNMGKKFLLVLLSICSLAGSAFAYSTPRWFNMPVSVYAPKQTESVAVVEAFDIWQLASKSTVRFLHRNSPNLAPISSINVVFVDSLPNEATYLVNHRFQQFGGCRNCIKDQFFYQTDITIVSKGADGVPLTSDKIRAIALQAVGVAVGVPLNDDENSVMYRQSNFTKSTLSDVDIRAVKNVYAPIYK